MFPVTLSDRDRAVYSLILNSHPQGLSQREITRALNVSRTLVGRSLRKLVAIGAVKQVIGFYPYRYMVDRPLEACSNISLEDMDVGLAARALKAAEFCVGRGVVSTGEVLEHLQVEGIPDPPGALELAVCFGLLIPVKVGSDGRIYAVRASDPCEEMMTRRR